MLIFCTDFQTPTCGTRKPTRMATGGWSMWTRISARCCARPRRRSRQRKRPLRPRRRVGPGPPAAAFTRRSLATARDHACCRRDSTAQKTRAADRPRQECADDQTPRATGVGNKNEASHHRAAILALWSSHCQTRIGLIRPIPHYQNLLFSVASTWHLRADRQAGQGGCWCCPRVTTAHRVAQVAAARGI